MKMTDSFKTGIEELNEILGGGLPFPSGTLIIGPPGASKTVFALEAASANTGKNFVVLTNNSPAELAKLVDGMKIKAEYTAIDCYSWLSGGKAEIDTLSNLSKILMVIEDRLKENSVIIFNSLTPLGFYNDEASIKRFIQELIAMAKSRKSALFIILDQGTYPPASENAFESLSDCVIRMDPGKGLRIIKAAGSQAPQKEFFYEATSKGFKLHKKAA